MVYSFVSDAQSLSYFFPREPSGQAIDEKVAKNLGSWSIPPEAGKLFKLDIYIFDFVISCPI